MEEKRLNLHFINIFSMLASLGTKVFDSLPKRYLLRLAEMLAAEDEQKHEFIILKQLGYYVLYIAY